MQRYNYISIMQAPRPKKISSLPATPPTTLAHSSFATTWKSMLKTPSPHAAPIAEKQVLS